MGAFSPESLVTAWPGVRAGAVDLGNSSHAPYSWHPEGGHDILTVDPVDFGRSVDVIARWLATEPGPQNEISVGERQMLEVLVGEVYKFIEAQTTPTNQDLRDDIAQIQAAVDSLQAQLRAPRPARRLVNWALRQIGAYTMGLASGATLQYLPELLRAFH